MYITPPCGGFRSPIARQPRGYQHGTIRLLKALAEVLPTPTFLAPYYSNCGDTEHGKPAQGGVIYTAVCGISLRLNMSEIHQVEGLNPGKYLSCFFACAFFVFTLLFGTVWFHNRVALGLVFFVVSETRPRACVVL